MKAAIAAILITAATCAAADYIFCEDADTITVAGTGSVGAPGPWLIECTGPAPNFYVVTAVVTVIDEGTWVVTFTGENLDLLKKIGTSKYKVFNPITGFVADSGSVSFEPC